MIYLKLFLSFLKVGAVSFGGGYGMISLIRDECLSHSWLTEGELLNFIAIAESTPGPIAVNMATFVGSSQGGLLGAFLATFGVVMPSFVIILLVASVLNHLMRYEPVRAILGGVRPAVIALILATAVTMVLSVVFGIKDLKGTYAFDLRALIVLAVLTVVYFAYLKCKKIAISPIVLIVISGLFGVLLY